METTPTTSTDSHDAAFEEDALVAWIEKSGMAYMEGVHQTCQLLGRADLWDRVAVRLVRSGVLLPEWRRYVTDAALAAL